MSKEQMNDQHIIDLLRSKKEHRALVRLYSYERTVVNHIKANSGTKDDGKDVYQEALIILMRKVNEPNFQLTSSLDTYLFGISKLIWKSKLSKKPKPSSNIISNSSLEEMMEVDELEKINLAEQAIDRVSQLCQQIFKFYYIEKLSMKIIASRLGHQSENTTKTMKYKCLEQAKNWFTESWAKEVNHA